MDTTVDRDAAAREAASRMAAAAAAWLDALDPAQRAVAAGGAPSADAESDAERRRWFYTPTDHGGLTLGAQRPAQQRLAFQLVASGLSVAGYNTVATIVGLDNVLDQVEGWRVDWGRERGRDPGLYYLRVFGEPGGAAPWGWRFGGHHVSLNNLVVDGVVRATTPCFFGADPASSPLLGPAPLRPLAGAEDLARELVCSLDPDQAARAVLLDRAPSDIVGGNRSLLSDGDQVIHLRDIWRGQFADPGLLDLVTRMGDGAEQASGYDAADHQRVALSLVSQGPAGGRAWRRAAGPAAGAAGHLPGTGPGRPGPGPGRRRAGRGAPGLGRAHRPGRTPLLPAAGPAAADRVRQHPAAGEPRAFGVARPGGRLRLRRARRPPGRASPGRAGRRSAGRPCSRRAGRDPPASIWMYQGGSHLLYPVSGGRAPEAAGRRGGGST